MRLYIASKKSACIGQDRIILSQSLACSGAFCWETFVISVQKASAEIAFSEQSSGGWRSLFSFYLLRRNMLRFWACILETATHSCVFHALRCFQSYCASISIISIFSACLICTLRNFLVLVWNSPTVILRHIICHSISHYQNCIVTHRNGRDATHEERSCVKIVAFLSKFYFVFNEMQFL